MAADKLLREHLRAIRGSLERLTDDMQDVKSRLGMLESQYAGLSNRMDRSDMRLLRIEKRLELAEA